MSGRGTSSRYNRKLKKDTIGYSSSTARPCGVKRDWRPKRFFARSPGFPYCTTDLPPHHSVLASFVFLHRRTSYSLARTLKSSLCRFYLLFLFVWMLAMQVAAGSNWTIFQGFERRHFRFLLFSSRLFWLEFQLVVVYYTLTNCTRFWGCYGDGLVSFQYSKEGPGFFVLFTYLLKAKI